MCVMMRGVWCVGCACESRADREGNVQYKIFAALKVELK